MASATKQEPGGSNHDRISSKEGTPDADSPKRKKDGHKSIGNSMDIDQGFNHSWEQTDDIVKIVLYLDRKIARGEIDVEFSDVDVMVKLTDGQEWQCNFLKKIQREECRAFIHKGKLILHVSKKDKGAHWTTLERVPRSEETEDKSISETRVGDENEEMEETTEEIDTGEPAPVFNLSLVKHDFYEKDLKSLVVHMYVKQVERDTLQVTFLEDQLIVTFRTTDKKFLSLQEDTDESTTFRWTVNTKDKLKPESCRYQLTASKVEIQLYKQEARRWGALEALAVKQTASQSAVLTDSWIPAHREPTATQSRAQTADQSKVIFDEISADQSKQKDPDWLTSSSSKINSRDGSRHRHSSGDAVKQNSGSGDSKENKPMCMVSPLNKDGTESVMVVPAGFTGLDNLGNTCFMNSVLQVLANTRELRDYFLEALFQKEINVDNPLGSGGKLVVAFAVLMKILWSGKHYSYAPAKLKNLVATKASQFTGFAQHDAQEFMAYLLDGLHEDLNRIKRKPYTQTVDSDGRPDEVVASEAWQVHKKRNDSFLVDLFQGQHKSTLVCPTCNKVSITFDPFMILPVPLPKKQRSLPIIFTSKDPYRKPVRYMVRLNQDATVDQLKEIVSQKTGVNAEDLRVFEAYKNRILTFFSKGSSLTSVNAKDRIMVSEVLSEKMAGEPVLEIGVVQRTLLPQMVPSLCSFCHREPKPGAKLKRCTKCYRSAYCDQSCQKNDWHQKHRGICRQVPELVGNPFIISLPQSCATFSRVCQMVEAFARYSVDVFQPPVSQEEKSQSPSPNCTSTSNGGDSNPSSAEEAPNGNSTNGNVASSTVTSGVGSSMATSASISYMDLASDNNSLSDDTTDSTTTQDSSCTLTMDGAQEMMERLEEVCDDAPGPLQTQTNTSQDTGIDTLSCDSVPAELPNPAQDLSTCESPVSSDIASCCVGEEKEKDLCIASGSGTLPTKYVMGRKQEPTEKPAPLFYLKPCDKDGHSLSGPGSERLEDQGDEPLDLAHRDFFAVDWKNNDKCKAYVLVQSKQLDYEDDSSMHTQGWDESNNITLEQCMSLFTEPEVLSPEDAWYCPGCKEHRQATKQMSVWRLPHTLIIQLKRFSFRNLIWRDKIDKMVEFPVRALDMSPYTGGKGPEGEPPPVYDLYGVINHHGGILGGHYTAFGRCPDVSNYKQNEVDWRLFDDSRVSSISEKQVMTRAAYVLFYRRRDSIVPKIDSLISDMEEGEDDEAQGEDSQQTLKYMSEESQPHSEDDSAHSPPTLATCFASGDGPLAGDTSETFPSTSTYTDMDAVD